MKIEGRVNTLFSMRKTKHFHRFSTRSAQSDGAKNIENRRKACRDHRAKAQNASFSSIFTRGMRNQQKINDFLVPSTGAQARRTFRNAYLQRFLKALSRPHGSPRRKKRPPSGTHESLCLLEGVALCIFTVVFALSHLRFHNPSTQIDNSDPFLR